MKNIKIFFGISTIMLAILFSSMNIANANEIDPGGLEGDEIICKCNFWGNCKVTGGGPTCATFATEGDCRQYDRNC
ncbi:hypothetical protein KCTC32516_00579 [Polaribacter huanghezhanensis]|uniref:hypothetical protein n=1 Tax=Polaribacter huanghezhanensis TaxID=1354726 RepID=UPI00264708B1|nr:hypothetical protein [Polaribacter huanghezhanensis]WKD85239.1 hypothetical protein KCTC32516_00579 [Polaribacter huanghezhanensis]